MSKQKHILVLSIINTVLFNILIILSLCFLEIKLWNILTKTSEYIITIILLIIVFIIFLSLSTLLNFIFSKDLTFKFKIIVSILTLNFVIFISTIKYDKPSNELIIKKRKFRFSIIDINIIALIISCYLVLDFISSFIPPLPFFITVSLKFIPIFFLSFIYAFPKVLITSLICGIISWFMPNNMDAGNFWAFIFDYYIPVIAVSFSSFLKPITSLNKILIVISWFLFIFPVTIIIYFSRVFGGVIFWFQGAWEGFDKWTYSLILNSFNSIFDLVLLLVMVPTICITLTPIKNRLSN